MIPPLHVVTDDAVLARPDFAERAAAVLAVGGAGVALHLRARETSAARLYALADALRGPAGASGALLLANDRIDLALAARLDGVHLRERSLPAAVARRLLPPGRLIGASVHSEETARAVASEADYLVVGTVFATSSHPARSGGGPALVQRVAAAAGGRPVLAIGGVTPERVAEVVAAGAHGVAVVSGVWSAADPEVAVRGYLEPLGRCASS